MVIDHVSECDPTVEADVESVGVSHRRQSVPPLLEISMPLFDSLRESGPSRDVGGLGVGDCPLALFTVPFCQPENLFGVSDPVDAGFDLGHVVTPTTGAIADAIDPGCQNHRIE